MSKAEAIELCQPLTKLIIKIYDGRIIHLQVPLFDTIASLKSTIHAMVDIPPEEQRLLFGGRQLANHKTVCDGGVQPDSTLYLVLCRARTPIFISSQDSGRIVAALWLEPCYTIETVKVMLESSQGVPVTQQRLAFDGQPLADEKALRDYRIEGGCTLSLDWDCADNVQRQSLLCLPLTLVHILSICVKTVTGSTLRLEVNSCDTIHRLKEQISDSEGTLPSDQCLLLRGKDLNDSQTVSYYELYNGIELHLLPTRLTLEQIKQCHFQRSPHLSHRFQIFILPLTGRGFAVDVDPTSTINYVKARVLKKLGVPLFRQRLFCVDTLLEDEQSLHDYGIQSESVVSLVVSFKLVIETTAESRIDLQVEDCVTVKEIKAQMEKKEDIPSSKQGLWFAGCELEDDRVLSDYSINRETTLHLKILFPIVIKTLSGRSIQLTVDGSLTIESLKANISDEIGVLPDQQRLFFSGEELDNRRTLSDYELESESTLQLLIRPRDGMQIHVRTFASRTITFDVEATDTAASVSNKIQHLVGVPPGLQRLIFADQCLADGGGRGLLCDYNIQHNSTVQLVRCFEIIVHVQSVQSTPSISLGVDESCTIGTVKRMIQDKLGLSPDRQCLLFDNGKLDDDRTLYDCGITQGQTLRLTNRFQLFIEISGKVVTIPVHQYCTIKNVKAAIQDKEGIAASKQCLFLRRNRLLNHRTLGHYRIDGDTTVQLWPSFEIFIQLPSRRIPLEVERSFTIRKVKEVLEDKAGVSRYNQCLFFAGSELLVEGRTLSDHHIVPGSTLDLEVNFLVFIETFRGTPCPLRVLASFTVARVKQLYQELEGLPSLEQRLFLADQELADDRRLSAYNVNKETTSLRLAVRLRIHVHIRGKTVPLEVGRCDTVRTVKAMIQRAEGIPSQKQCLLFHGKKLKPNRTLADYSIESGAVIDLFIKQWNSLKDVLLACFRGNCSVDV